MLVWMLCFLYIRRPAEPADAGYEKAGIPISNENPQP